MGRDKCAACPGARPVGPGAPGDGRRPRSCCAVRAAPPATPGPPPDAAPPGAVARPAVAGPGLYARPCACSAGRTCWACTPTRGSFGFGWACRASLRGGPVAPCTTHHCSLEPAGPLPTRAAAGGHPCGPNYAAPGGRRHTLTGSNGVRRPGAPGRRPRPGGRSRAVCVGWSRSAWGGQWGEGGGGGCAARSRRATRATDGGAGRPLHRPCRAAARFNCTLRVFSAPPPPVARAPRARLARPHRRSAISPPPAAPGRAQGSRA
jgi:hypothetical protein